MFKRILLTIAFILALSIPSIASCINDEDKDKIVKICDETINYRFKVYKYSFNILNSEEDNTSTLFAALTYYSTYKIDLPVVNLYDMDSEVRNLMLTLAVEHCLEKIDHIYITFQSSDYSLFGRSYYIDDTKNIDWLNMDASIKAEGDSIIVYYRPDGVYIYKDEINGIIRYEYPKTLLWTEGNDDRHLKTDILVRDADGLYTLVKREYWE